MELEEIQRQHYDSYIMSIREIIKNNTNSFIDIDINSLIESPPLDSMDLIKTKFLALAKKEKIILNADKLNSIVKKYRENTMKKMEFIRNFRIEELNKVIDKNIGDSNNVIKISKQSINSINSQMKKKIKVILDESIQEDIVKKYSLLFQKDENKEIIDKIEKEMTKYLSCRGIYQKQTIESIDFKLLVL